MLRLPLVFVVLLPLLAACGNAPEQPSDVPDTQPDLLPGDSEETGTESIAPIPEPPTTESASPTAVLGDWAADPAACADTAGAPVRITATRFESTAEACDIGDLVDNGAGFTASLTCEGEGGSNAALLKLQPEGDTLTLNWVGRDEPALVLNRCG